MGIYLTMLTNYILIKKKLGSLLVKGRKRDTETCLEILMIKENNHKSSKDAVGLHNRDG